MSNPARAPQEFTGKQLELCSLPDAYLKEGFQDAAKRLKQPKELMEALKGKDLEWQVSFVVPKDQTLDPAVLNAARPVLATAKTGKPVPRVRTLVAKTVQARVASKLPIVGSISRGVFEAKARDRVFAEGGTEATVGRLAKAYPDKGATPFAPPSRREALGALANCGLTVDHLPAHARRPFPLHAPDGEVSVSVNPKAGSGFPVLMAWSTPGVPEKVTDLAVSMRAEMKVGRVEEWLRDREQRAPYLVAVRGKAKADYYSPEKVEKAQMRFYNEFPRQCVMIMQQATQPLELLSRNIFTEGHSGIGVSLVRGGARLLVERLDLQVNKSGAGYVHVGDDSWVCVRYGDGKLGMFALDCSNFDLTQHARATAEVHWALREQLATIDRVAAELWYAYARSRRVVLVGSAVAQMNHGGPSGLPLQSKVNDMLMDILITRAVERVRRLTEAGREQQVGTILDEVGRGMGFSVRLEQYSETRADSVREALAEVPFLFIGYYFHNTNGYVEVMCDLPRTLAQLPYPSVKWMKRTEDLEVVEAMRIGSIAQNLGMPLRGFESTLSTFREEACSLVERALQRYGDVKDPRLRWAVQASPWGAEVEAGLAGLLRALRRPAILLWNQTEELPSVSTLIPLGEPVSWADEAEAEEGEELKKLGLKPLRVPEALRGRRVHLRLGVVATHPVTPANVGRPPPTAVWGPDRAPRLRLERVPARTRRKDGIAARDERATWSEPELSDESYDS